VLPPWWRTWWAYVLYALILGVGIFVVNRLQQRRLIRQERAKAEIEQVRLRAEAAEILRESEQRFRELFEASADAIFVEDFEGKVLDVNPAAGRLHGLERAQLIGQNVRALVPPEEREHVMEKVARMVSGDLVRFEGKSWTVAEEKVPVEISVSHVTFARGPALLLQVRDVTERKQAEEEREKARKEREKVLQREKELRAQAAEMSSLLKKMFGRYLSAEVMNTLIENPSALELGGERKKVTIMMTDLRGFTALSERLEPEQVVQMLNTYFEIMVDLVLKYNGTVNEFIGDSLLVIFGAPQEMEDRAQRAVACSIEMQNAMVEVNNRNSAEGLPEIEMGIGLNETEVIVGNIGSSKRSKYAIVGSGVNLTSRIESYTVGGQILVSESVRKEAGEVLRIDAQRDVFPKGAEASLRIYEVGGISGPYNLVLVKKVQVLTTLVRQIPLQYTVIEGKKVGEKELEGCVVRLSKSSAEITLGGPVELLNNLKLKLKDVDEQLSARDFYGKVIKRSAEKENTYIVSFTSLPSEVDAYFQACRQYAIVK
jgi:PAS domain S-box-containing protein